MFYQNLQVFAYIFKTTKVSKRHHVIRGRENKTYCLSPLMEKQKKTAWAGAQHISEGQKEPQLILGRSVRCVSAQLLRTLVKETSEAVFEQKQLSIPSGKIVSLYSSSSLRGRIVTGWVKFLRRLHLVSQVNGLAALLWVRYSRQAYGSHNQSQTQSDILSWWGEYRHLVYA